MTIILIFVSCCSSSPDCSMQVVRTLADPVGESFIELESLKGLVPKTVGQLFRSAFVIAFDRSRKILSSSAFNESKTDGGVK